MSRLPDAFIEEVRARTSLVEVIRPYAALRKHGPEWMGRCPFHNERTPSFTVNEHKGFYHCFGCGAHGGAVDFVMAQRGLGFRDAVELLAAEAGLALPGESAPREARRLAPVVQRQTQASRAEDEADKAEWARGVWRQAEPAPATLAQIYLGSRGIALDPPPSIRFAASLLHSDTGLWLPAMVAAFQAVDRQIVGIHRTFLKLDGKGKAAVSSPKKMGGQCWGAAIRMAPAAEVLAVGEGIETTLSVMQACPGLAGWVAGSLGNIAGGGLADGARRPHPAKPDTLLPTEEPDHERPGILLPPQVRELIILADADGDRPTQSALIERAVRRYQRLRLRVRVAWPAAGGDFNDMAQSSRTDKEAAP